MFSHDVVQSRRSSGLFSTFPWEAGAPGGHDARCARRKLGAELPGTRASLAVANTAFLG